MRSVKGQVGVSRICKEGCLSFVNESLMRNHYDLGEAFNCSNTTGCLLMCGCKHLGVPNSTWEVQAGMICIKKANT